MPFALTTQGATHVASAEVERGLAGLGAANDEHVEPGDDRGLQEARRVRGQRAQYYQLVEVVRLQHELADVDRHVPAVDVRGDDEHLGAVGAASRRRPVDMPIRLPDVRSIRSTRAANSEL